MPGTNYLAVIVVAVAAFVMSSVYYIIFGKARMKLLGDDPDAGADVRKIEPWKILVELARSFIVALAVAHLIFLGDVVGWIDGLQLGLWIAIGFPVMILVGSVVWDKRPWQLAAIHAGDWLLKLLLMAVVLSVWR
jgi:Protein of unknown function (DUF1761)